MPKLMQADQAALDVDIIDDAGGDLKHADSQSDKKSGGKKETEARLKTEIKARFKTCEAHYSDWTAEAKEDYAFAMGDQWTDEDRTQLKNEGRPCLTFNRIRPLINIVAGYQREHAARIKVSPEGGEDVVFSDVCDKLLHFSDKTSKLSYKMGYWFDEGCYAGKSFLEAIISYDADPVRGELKFVLRAPYEILVDPSFKDYDLNDGCRYLFKVSKITKGELKKLFPEKKAILNALNLDTDDETYNATPLQLEGIKDDYGNKPGVSVTLTKRIDDAVPDNTEFADDVKFTVKEYWRIKNVEKFFVIDADSGEPDKFDDEEEAQEKVDEQNKTAKERGEPGGFKIITRTVPEMWVADMVCGRVMQDIRSPFEPHYSGYPFFRMLADWAPNATTEVSRVQSLVRPLKDPQREKNKSKSQYLHILNTQANSGWIGDSDAMSTEGWKKLEQMGSKPGITVKKKKGADLREIQPKGPNQGHLIREQKADDEFKQISNINPDLMGMNEQETSGRAMSMRIKQGVLALARLFSNYRYSKEIIGDFVLQMIPMMFDVKKVKKVLGPKYMAAQKGELYQNGLDEGHLAAFLTMIKDNKYEVLVTEADDQSSLRYETFTELSDLAKAGLPIPPDLLMEYLDIPNAEEVKGKVAQYAQAQQAANAAKGAGGPQ